MSTTSSGKKNNTKKRINHEIERVTIRSGRSADAVPHQNVLDLRSIVAKRELQSATVQRLQAEAAFKREQQKERAQEVQKKERRVNASFLTRFFGEKVRTAQKQPKLSTPHHTVVYSSKKEEESLRAHVQKSEQKPLVLQPVNGLETFGDDIDIEENLAAEVGQEVILPVIEEDVPEQKPRHKARAEKRKKKILSKKTKTHAARFPSLKPTLAFAVVSLLFILPASVSAALSQATTVQHAVTDSAQLAFEHLYQAGVDFQALKFDEAKIECDAAYAGFTDGQKQVKQLNPVLTAVAQYVPVTGKQFTSGVALLNAGQELAQAGQQLSAGLSVLSAVDIGNIAKDENGGLANILEVVHSSLSPAAEHIINASRAIQTVSVDAVPEDKRQYVLLAQQALPEIESTVTNGVDLTETLLAFLGHEDPKRYAVLFQNNHEMRPTGGFIGSLALVDIDNGSVKEIEVPGGGVYDISGQLDTQVIAPQPLHIVNPLWNLQDANWFPQFSASAQKIEWFLQHSKVTDVDGVITVVPSVIEKLLTITGPIDLTQDFGVVITADNFYDEVQNRAEEKYDVTRESKKIIGEMTPLLLNQLFAKASTPDGLMQIVSALRDALAEKNVLVYMNDPRLQTDFSSRDWTGELKTTDRDYLAIFHANIGGGKTDDAIEQIVKHNASIDADGNIIDTVSLTRVHKGATQDDLRSIKNVDYVRFYVPQGSTLIAATGFETPAKELFLPDADGAVADQDLSQITGTVTSNAAQQVFTNTEFEKTVFAGWVQTEAGNSTTVTLQYKLPFTLQTHGFWDAIDHYSLLVQKQPGSFGDFFTSDVTLPKNLQIVRTFPTEYTGETQTVLNADQFVGMVLSQK